MLLHEFVVLTISHPLLNGLLDLVVRGALALDFFLDNDFVLLGRHQVELVGFLRLLAASSLVLVFLAVVFL